jgi:hypothetical protein
MDQPPKHISEYRTARTVEEDHIIQTFEVIKQDKRRNHYENCYLDNKIIYTL